MGGSIQQRIQDLTRNEIRKRYITSVGKGWEKEYSKHISSHTHVTTIIPDIASFSAKILISFPGMVPIRDKKDTEHISYLVETVKKLTCDALNTTPLTQLMEAYNHPDTFDYENNQLTFAAITNTLCNSPTRVRDH